MWVRTLRWTGVWCCARFGECAAAHVLRVLYVCCLLPDSGLFLVRLTVAYEHVGWLLVAAWLHFPEPQRCSIFGGFFWCLPLEACSHCQGLCPNFPNKNGWQSRHCDACAVPSSWWIAH